MAAASFPARIRPALLFSGSLVAVAALPGASLLILSLTGHVLAHSFSFEIVQLHEELEIYLLCLTQCVLLVCHDARRKAQKLVVLLFVFKLLFDQLLWRELFFHFLELFCFLVIAQNGRSRALFPLFSSLNSRGIEVNLFYRYIILMIQG